MTTLLDDDVEELAGASRTEALVERLAGSLIRGVEVLSIELGRRLGLYEAMANSRPVSPAELAEATGIQVRYAEEWLAQQAAAGFVERASAHPARYLLPVEHVPVLTDGDSAANKLGVAPVLAGLARTLPDVARAYVEGTGVGYAEFGADFAHGIAILNRPGFLHEVRDWLKQLPDLSARLDRGGRVLDVGCGHGWSSIGLARAFPRATVVGVDRDEASVRTAREHVDAAGLGHRVTILSGNAADAELLRTAEPAGYDLVTVFQALHDMGSPDLVLAALRSVIGESGAVLVADEHSGGTITNAPGEPVERLQLAVSVLHCLPATWAESSRVVNGTVLRTRTLQQWAFGAGFDSVETLDIDHPFWRFYRLG